MLTPDGPLKTTVLGVRSCSANPILEINDRGMHETCAPESTLPIIWHWGDTLNEIFAKA